MVRLLAKGPTSIRLLFGANQILIYGVTVAEYQANESWIHYV